MPELDDSNDAPLTPKEQRRRLVDGSTPHGTWYIVKEMMKPKKDRKYGRRDEDVPFWWLVMDKWGINSLLYALATIAAYYLVSKWGGGHK